MTGRTSTSGGSGGAGPTVHCVVSTVGRPELGRLLHAIAAQGVDVHVTLVEQAPEPRSRALLQRDVPATYVHQPAVRGVSRGRNAGTAEPVGEVVAFPDDDCWFAPGLYPAVLDLFETTGADVVTVRQTDGHGADSLMRWRRREGFVAPRHVPRCASSSTIFVRRRVLDVVGPFDEHLGVGAGSRCGAGEDLDYVLRAMGAGFSVYYCPRLEVHQADWRGRDDDAVRARTASYNRGFGCVLREHGRTLDWGYWVARSVVGVLLAAARRDRRELGRQAAQLGGRVAGYLRIGHSA